MQIRDILSFKNDGLSITFRALNSSDITDKYLEALRLEKHFLLNRNNETTHTDQSKYVEGISKSTASAIFGVFANSDLIGTVGAQQLDSEDGAALGVFIFDRRYANRGLGKAAIWAGCYLLHDTMGTTRFRAGVAHDNPISQRIFIGCGFSLQENKKEKLLFGMHIAQLRNQPQIDPQSIRIASAA